MWFLKTDTLFIIIAYCLFSGALGGLLGHRRIFWAVCPAAALGVICYIDMLAAAFYAGYICIALLMTHILHKAEKRKGLLMVLLCTLALVPFILSRFPALFPITGGSFMIGIAFNMLKVIDALYYVYYGGQAVRPLIFINYMLFIPVFTAGPVIRYRDFLKEADAKPKADKLYGTLERIIRGLFKKVVMVKLLIMVFDRLRELTPNTAVSLAVIVMSYLILYFDLSGYSDIALGLSQIAGVTAAENFKKPWTAPTLTQFWRSWHASVSDFIREHIYVVLSKYKLNKWHSGIIGLFSMILMSMWHDFNLLFLIAGVYNGLLLFFENIFALTTVNKRKANKLYYIFRCIVTNLLFAVNTLVFTLSPDEILPVLSGLIHIF